MFTNNKGISEKDHVKKINDSIIDPQLQKLLDSSKLSGSILIFDVEKGKYFCSNDFALTKKVFLPASTFKVPNTLIGLETGIININTIFKWDGKKRKLKIWEKDLNLHDAFHASCVPCFQELAEKIGPKRMQEYLNKFEYGNSNISPDNIKVFWLEGNALKITMSDQLAFIKKLYYEKLPVKAENMKILKALMEIETGSNYRLFGKTGWAIRDDYNIGWFVGWALKGERLLFLITNVSPYPDMNMDEFPSQRLKVSKAALDLIF